MADLRVEGLVALLRSHIQNVEQTYTAGRLLFFEGDPGDKVFVLKSGLVRCYRVSPDGRRFISRFPGAEQIIGPGFRTTQFFTAETIVPTTVISFRARSLARAVEENAEVRGAIVRSFTNELVERERVEFRLARMGSLQRVADFLLERGEVERARTIRLDMSRCDMADYLGLTLETVSRCIHRLDNQDIIRLQGAHQVELRDIAGLTEIVNGEIARGRGFRE